jgi:putative ABC transport system ATP-binding protein
MIELKSLSHSYKGGQTIGFKDWHINTGERWLLLGNSGSGKTTLLHIMTGILQPSAGKVNINGTSIYDLSSRSLDQFRGRNVGIVFQRPHLINSLSILENMIIVQRFANLSKDMDRIKAVLASLDISHKQNAYPNQLSQGQLQRVSIARAVLNNPALLIADEPTQAWMTKMHLRCLSCCLPSQSLTKQLLLLPLTIKESKIHLLILISYESSLHKLEKHLF